MKPFILSIFFLFSAIQLSAFDYESDQRIHNCVHSETFSNLTIYYPYQGKQYPIQIIHNPKREMLWSGAFANPFSCPLIVVADLPRDLIRHLKEICPEIDDDDSDVYIDLKGRSSLGNYVALKPVYIARRVDDPTSDRLVTDWFQSSKFVNQVLYYQLAGKYYKVRIIHNPEKLSLTGTMQCNLQLSTGYIVKALKIDWGYRYGVIVDKQAPEELADHLSSLANSSYWDWYFNFHVDNGEYVTYREVSWDYDTIYSVDTWFNFTENLRLAE